MSIRNSVSTFFHRYLRIPYTLHTEVFQNPKKPAATYVFIHGIGNKVSKIFCDTFNIDERETRKVLQELVTILEQYEMPELAQALKE